MCLKHLCPHECWFFNELQEGNCKAVRRVGIINTSQLSETLDFVPSFLQRMSDWQEHKCLGSKQMGFPHLAGSSSSWIRNILAACPFAFVMVLTFAFIIGSQTCQENSCSKSYRKHTYYCSFSKYYYVSFYQLHIFSCIFDFFHNVITVWKNSEAKYASGNNKYPFI